MFTLSVFDAATGEYQQDTEVFDFEPDAYFAAARVAGLYEDADWQVGEDRGNFITFRHGHLVRAIAIDDVGTIYDDSVGNPYGEVVDDG
jgi:hypothetical protein